MEPRTSTVVEPGLWRFAGRFTTRAYEIAIDQHGAVTIRWYLNDEHQYPPAAGWAEIRLQIISTNGLTAIARVVSRTDPPDIPPDIGPGHGPPLQVGDTYTFTVGPRDPTA